MFCTTHTWCIPLWEDLSVNLRPEKTSVTNFSTQCLSDTVKPIVLLKNLTGFTWVDGIISKKKKEKYQWMKFNFISKYTLNVFGNNSGELACY